MARMPMRALPVTLNQRAAVLSESGARRPGPPASQKASRRRPTRARAGPNPFKSDRLTITITVTPMIAQWSRSLSRATLASCCGRGSFKLGGSGESRSGPPALGLGDNLTRR